MSFIRELHRKAVQLYNEISRYPFLIELANGNLPRGKYIYYLQQDILYLQVFYNTINKIISNIPCRQTSSLLSELAVGAQTIEDDIRRKLTTVYFVSPILSTQQSRVFADYCQHLKGSIIEGAYIGVGLAAVYFCLDLYYRLATEMNKHLHPQHFHPYRDWIEGNSDATILKLIETIEPLLDSYAQRQDKYRQSMLDTALKSLQFEYLVFHDCYHMGQINYSSSSVCMI